MFKSYIDLVPDHIGHDCANSVEVAEYPEYNLPPLEVPNLDNPKEVSKVIVNEIYDLFNVQRLAGFEADIIESVRSNILQSSQFTEAISKLSDDEIMESIKPRNIQSPSQLVSWSKYIQSVIEDRIQSATASQSSTSTDSLNEPNVPQVDTTE